MMEACSRSRPPHLVFFLFLEVGAVFSPPKPSQSFPSAVPAATIPFDATESDMMKGGDIEILSSWVDRLAGGRMGVHIVRRQSIKK